MRAREQITAKIDECNQIITELGSGDLMYSEGQRTERIEKMKRNIEDLESERVGLDGTAKTLNETLQMIQKAAENEMTELEKARETAEFEKKFDGLVNSSFEMINESKIFRMFAKEFVLPLTDAMRALESAQCRLQAEKEIREDLNLPDFTS